MRLIRLAAAVIAAVSAAYLIACGADTDYISETSEIAMTSEVEEALPDSARRILNDADIASVDFGNGLSGIWDALKRELADRFSESMSGFGLLFTVSALCGFASSVVKVSDGFSPVSLCASAAVLSVSISGVRSVISICKEALSQINVFSASLFPSMAAAAAAVGSPTAGSTISATALAVTGILISVINGILFPAVYIYILITAVDAAVGSELMARTASFIKRALSGMLKTLLVLYITYSGITSTVASTADKTAVKTAGLAMSGAIPVVGSVVSDAAEAVLAGASVVKNAVGVFGLLGIASVCVIPFVRAGSYYIVYKAAAAVSSVIADKPTNRLIDAIGDGFGMALGMLGSSAVLMFISISLSILAVKPV